MKKFFCIVFALLITLTGCGNDNEESSIRVFVDSSLANAMEEVISKYNEENPANIEMVSDSSSTLCGRIEDGAKCDIFIPSSKEQINTLIEGELLKSENVTPILTNSMVLISGYGKDSGTTTVKSFDTVTEAKSIALVNESDPAGLFAREIFINLNAFKAVLNMKSDTYTDSPSAAAAVAEGKDEIGVCYETDALSYADKVQIITFAPKDSLNSEIIYSVALLNTQEGLEPSEKVIDFAQYLDSPEAAEIFGDYDFGIYMN